MFPEPKGKDLDSKYHLNAHQGQHNPNKIIKIKVTTIIITIRTTLPAKTTIDSRINKDKGSSSKDSSNQDSLSKEVINKILILNLLTREDLQGSKSNINRDQCKRKDLLCLLDFLLTLRDNIKSQDKNKREYLEISKIVIIQITIQNRITSKTSNIHNIKESHINKKEDTIGKDKNKKEISRHQTQDIKEIILSLIIIDLITHNKGRNINSNKLIGVEEGEEGVVEDVVDSMEDNKLNKKWGFPLLHLQIEWWTSQNSYHKNKKARKQASALNNIKAHVVVHKGSNLNNQAKDHKIHLNQIKILRFPKKNIPNHLMNFKDKLLLQATNPRYNLAIVNKINRKYNSNLFMMIIPNKSTWCVANNNTT